MGGGLTSSLNIGLSGLQVNQAALNVVGHNIANVNTPGYSRQRAVLASNASVNYGGVLFGNGASLNAIQGMRDKFLELQMNQSISRQKGSETRSAGLQAMAVSFQDLDGNGISTRVQAFLQGFQELAARPEDSAIRENLVGRAQNMIDGLKARYSQMTEQQTSLDQNVDGLVQQVNTIAIQIAKLNERVASEPSPGSDSDARDQRQVLASSLAELTGLQGFLDSRDQLQITFATGASLVSGGQAFTVQSFADPATSPYKGIRVASDRSNTSFVTVTPDIKEGVLGATMDLRDRIIPGIERKLDEMAAGVVGEVNKLHRTGYGLTGVTGVDFFVVPGSPANPPNPTPNGANGLPATITAATNYKGMVNSMFINATVKANPKLIAAANAANVPGDNTIAQNLGKLQTALNTVDTDGNGVGDSGPFNTVIAGIVNSVGTQAQSYEAQSITDENLMTALQNQRTQLSGVDLDEEATQMLVLQRGYSASARFVSVINQLTDQLINNTLS